LTCELTDARIKPVAGDDLVLGQWVRRYHASHGIRVGDTLALQLMSNGEWLATEVISRTRIDRDRIVPPSKGGGD
jgi:hypothetical protein